MALEKEDYYEEQEGYCEERCLREMLAMLQEDCARAAKPYIDRLVTIHSMRPSPPMVVPLTLEQAQALGIMLGEVK